jgi:hypothetical protein
MTVKNYDHSRYEYKGFWHKGSKVFNSIEDFPEGCHGFVYKIHSYETDHFYVGKKILENNIKRKIGKKEKALIEGKGRKPSFERLQKESNWKEYWSSSKILLEEYKKYGQMEFERLILDFAFSKKHLTYLELKYQFEYNVLEDKLSLNDNILGKFFRKDLVTP